MANAEFRMPNVECYDDLEIPCVVGKSFTTKDTADTDELSAVSNQLFDMKPPVQTG